MSILSSKSSVFVFIWLLYKLIEGYLHHFKKRPSEIIANDFAKFRSQIYR
jgi:hypothetical protein